VRSFRLVKALIFAGIQRVKTGLFYKSNSQSFIDRGVCLLCRGTLNNSVAKLFGPVIHDTVSGLFQLLGCDVFSVENLFTVWPLYCWSCIAQVAKYLP